MKKWLITGGCGFIGARLVHALLRSGDALIHIVDNQSVGKITDITQSADTELQITHQILDSSINSAANTLAFFNNAVSDQIVLDEIIPEMDVVVHLAANTGVQPSIQNPSLDFQQNVVAVFDVLDAIRRGGSSHFIFASSGAPLGNVSELPIHEEIAPHPVSPYGASKLAGEGYCSAYQNAFNIKTTVLRFGNVYGPGSIRKNSVVAKFLKLAMDSKPVTVFGNGDQTRDYIYVDDLVEAILCSTQKEDTSGTFQIATNRETSINELIDKMIPICAKYGHTMKLDRSQPLPPGDVQRNFSDTSKAMKKLGWRANTNLETGLEKTIEYLTELNNSESR